jgi:predicted Rossmann-fold nucleotide-binding protein
VLEEQRFPSLHERLLALIDGCDAAIALPGGVGTLLEIAMMWNRMIIDAIPHQPLILVGESWRETMAAFYAAQGDYVSDYARQLLSFGKDVDEAFDLLQEHFKTG